MDNAKNTRQISLQLNSEEAVQLMGDNSLKTFPIIIYLIVSTGRWKRQKKKKKTWHMKAWRNFALCDVFTFFCDSPFTYHVLCVRLRKIKKVCAFSGKAHVNKLLGVNVAVFACVVQPGRPGGLPEVGLLIELTFAKETGYVLFVLSCARSLQKL